MSVQNPALLKTCDLGRIPGRRYARHVDEERSTAAVLEAIDGLPVTEEPAPSDVDPFWVECVRGSLRGWATELRRDARRAGRGLAQAATAAGGTPDDDQIAALEEVLWRLHSAVERVDAIIAIAFGAGGIRLYDANARSLRFDPSEEANSTRLRDLGTSTALRLREVRGRLEGERAILRRHQLAHSLVPLVDLHDLACYILVHHRDGRIIVGGYELGALGRSGGTRGCASCARRRCSRGGLRKPNVHTGSCSSWPARSRRRCARTRGSRCRRSSSATRTRASWRSSGPSRRRPYRTSKSSSSSETTLRPSDAS